MPKSVQFFFDFGSPTSYLAHRELPKIAEKHGPTVDWIPVLLGGIFPSTGNAAPTSLPAKEKWMREDLALWASRRGLPFRFNCHFPANTLSLQRGAVALKGTRFFGPYLDSIYDAMWLESRSLADWSVIEETVAAQGITPPQFVEWVADLAVKETLKRNTDEAVSLGAFGCPTFLVGDALFFGQDRLDFVEDALRS